MWENILLFGDRENLPKQEIKQTKESRRETLDCIEISVQQTP